MSGFTVVSEAKDLRQMIREELQEAMRTEINNQQLIIHQEDQLLSGPQVRQFAKCGNSRVYKALASGALPSIEKGKAANGSPRRFARHADVVAWIAKGAPTEVQS